MNFFKKGLWMAAMCSTLIFVSCDKDDDCMSPDVSENIIGTWDVQTGGEVEFQSDGTLVDPSDAIIGGEVNGQPYDDKSYNITNDSLFVQAASTSGQINIALGIESNECDKIVISLFTIPVEMNRK